MAIGIQRYFAAVRVYEPGHSHHLNFERLTFAVDLMINGTPGRISEQFRERYPDSTPQAVHDYFCAAQTVVSHDINLSEVPD